MSDRSTDIIAEMLSPANLIDVAKSWMDRAKKAEARIAELERQCEPELCGSLGEMRRKLDEAEAKLRLIGESRGACGLCGDRVAINKLDVTDGFLLCPNCIKEQADD